MHQRIIAVTAACCLATAAISGQVPAPADVQPRIRLTGQNTFEIPGVIRIDGQNVTSGAHLVSDESSASFDDPITSDRLTVVLPGKRLVGQALGVDKGILSFRAEPAQKILHIPLSAVDTFELSEARARSHVLRGILVGFGAFWGAGALTFSACGLGCSNAAIIPAVVGGALAGAWAGRGHERWIRQPRAWLSSHVMGSAATPGESGATPAARDLPADHPQS